MGTIQGDGNDTGLYAAGMAFHDGRPLLAEEGANLNGLARRLRAQGLASLGGIAFLLLLTAPAVLAPEPGVAVRSLLILGAILGTLSLLLHARRDLVRARDLRADIAAGVVAIHDASVSGPSDAGEPASSHVEMLPRSGVVLRIDGVAPAGATVLERVSVANVPESAALAAQWLQPPADADEATPYLCNRRALSPAEQREIARHRMRMLRTPWLLLAVFDIYYILGLASFLWSPVVSRIDLFYWSVVTLVLIYTHRHPARQLLLALRLGRDAAVGSLQIVQLSPPGPDHAPSPVFEVLPQSRVVWTKDGRPAPWRTVSNPRVG